MENQTTAPRIAPLIIGHIEDGVIGAPQLELLRKEFAMQDG